MANLTVEIDDSLMIEVKRRLADSKGVTASSIVRDALARFVGRNLKTRYDYLRAFAEGAISRQQVQEALGVSYGDAIVLMAQFELELPRVSPERAERDASKLASLMAGDA